jgi:hypothetical protein
MTGRGVCLRSTIWAELSHVHVWYSTAIKMEDMWTGTESLGVNLWTHLDDTTNVHYCTIWGIRHVEQYHGISQRSQSYAAILQTHTVCFHLFSRGTYAFWPLLKAFCLCAYSLTIVEQLTS